MVAEGKRDIFFSSIASGNVPMVLEISLTYVSPRSLMRSVGSKSKTKQEVEVKERWMIEISKN